MAPPSTLNAASESPTVGGGALNAAFDQLVVATRQVLERLEELDYRLSLAAFVAIVDDRPQVESTSEDLAVAVADLRAASETHQRLHQQLGEICNVPVGQRDAATIATRVPEPWRTQLQDLQAGLYSHVERTRDVLARATGATRSNERLISASIAAAIGTTAPTTAVTYGSNALASADALLIDGRA